LLTTGVDAPTCNNVVLARGVGSMTEFKQIIGRGTRVRDDYGKLWFNIIDYTGSATRLFADPAFDGDPVRETEESLTPEGETQVIRETAPADLAADETEPEIIEPPSEERRKYYFDGGQMEIAAHLVYELDPDGTQLRVVRYIDYAAERVRTLCPTVRELREHWAVPDQRAEIIQRLEARGISFAMLADAAQQPDADPLDLLCHLAFNAPLRTRRERAQQLRTERKNFFTGTVPRRGRFWRSCWRNTPSTAMPSSSCRTSSTSRRFPRTGPCGRSSPLSAGPTSCDTPCRNCRPWCMRRNPWHRR
jgi:type I restriction enzyme R subunit